MERGAQRGNASGLQIMQGIENIKAETHGHTASILDQDWTTGWQNEHAMPEWAARYRQNGQDACYSINDPFRPQMLLQDALEYLVHGRIAYRTSFLNPLVPPFNPRQRDIKFPVAETNNAKTETQKVTVNNAKNKKNNRREYANKMGNTNKNMQTKDIARKRSRK